MYLEALLPQEEPIEGMIRVKKNMYPSIALREAIANALSSSRLTRAGFEVSLSDLSVAS